jgi:hypothetical protein
MQDESLEILRTKNADYANEEDPYQNFTLCEKLGICKTEKGMLVRMTDKLQRIANLIDRDAAVQGETVSDTLNDLANYSYLLRDFIEQRQ